MPSVFLASKQYSPTHSSVIYDRMVADLKSGAIPPGALLGTTKELAAALGCSPGALDVARRRLLKEGLLVYRGNRYLAAGEREFPTMEETPPEPSKVAADPSAEFMNDDVPGTEVKP